MQFLKRNSYDIVRLVLNQFALAVFGVVLTTAARMRADGGFDWLTLVVSIFSTLFYLYILYATLLEMGGKHKVKIDSGSMAEDKHLGLKLMLFAQIPNFLILFLMLLGWVFGHAVAHNPRLLFCMACLFCVCIACHSGGRGILCPRTERKEDFFQKAADVR